MVEVALSCLSLIFIAFVSLPLYFQSPQKEMMIWGVVDLMVIFYKDFHPKKLCKVSILGNFVIKKVNNAALDECRSVSCKWITWDGIQVGRCIEHRFLEMIWLWSVDMYILFLFSIEKSHTKQLGKVVIWGILQLKGEKIC